jgi:vanillate O-demethylase monooxygenase subunit
VSEVIHSNVRNYPLNCWYVAATSAELGTELIARRLLGQSVVLCRHSNSSVVALANRCPHRGAPLSRGRLVDDQVVCGYHGFTFASDGACVNVPSQEHVPPGSRVRAFPIREEPPFVWIWPGDAAKSTLIDPPQLPWLRDHDGWRAAGGTEHVAANYLLLHDNALDLTHLPHVHREASPPGYLTPAPPLEIELTETSVRYSRTFPAAPLVDWQTFGTGLDRGQSRALREWGTFVSPALIVAHLDILAEDDSPEAANYESVFVRALTPESATATHVFWRVARNYALADGTVGERLAAMQHKWMVEDKVLIEEIQAQPATSWPQMDVSADMASTRARQIVEKLLAEERGRAVLRPGFGHLPPLTG